MRDIAVITFLTLDGVMQSPSSPEEDPSNQFEQGGWARECWDEVMNQVRTEAMSEPYDALFGRKTYEMFAAHFPNAGDSLEVNRLKSATKYVVTSTLSKLDWKDAVAIPGSRLVDDIKQLKRGHGPLIQIHGSWQLIQTLLAHELVDEFRLWTFPSIVGAGKRLFGDGAVKTPLRLLKTKATRNGAVMTIYRRSAPRPS